MNEFQKFLSKYATYIEELRHKLLFLTKVFILFFVVGFFATPPVMRWIMMYVHIDGVTVVTTSPFQLVDFAMSVGFSLACIITIPILIYNLYSFLRPGLLPTERKAVIFYTPLGLLLFLFGFLYGGGMLYYGIKLISKLNTDIGIANYWDISKFISQIILTASLLGVLFIMPLVLNLLIRFGMLSVSFLRSKRRHVFAGIFILVSLLPPTDGLSLILMAMPLLLLFELTILFNSKNNRGRKLSTKKII